MDQLKELSDRIEIVEKSLDKGSPSTSAWSILEKLMIPISLGLLAFFVNSASIRIEESQLLLNEQTELRHAEDANKARELKYLELFVDKLASPDPKTQYLAISALTLLGDDNALLLAEMASRHSRNNEAAATTRNIIREMSRKQRLSKLILNNIDNIQQSIDVVQTSSANKNKSAKNRYVLRYRLEEKLGSQKIEGISALDLIEKVVYRHDRKWYKKRSAFLENSRVENFQHTVKVWGSTLVSVDVYGIGIDEPIFTRTARMRTTVNEEHRF